jgi:hypothetical protein
MVELLVQQHTISNAQATSPVKEGSDEPGFRGTICIGWQEEKPERKGQSGQVR